tara:strand:- start:41441 stop:41608 length:168 start_codon:yes stop_codon:yes gene_type:complete
MAGMEKLRQNNGLGFGTVMGQDYEPELSRFCGFWFCFDQKAGISPLLVAITGRSC